MLRKLLIAAAVAGLAALPASAAPSTRGASTQTVTQALLLPGVSYQRQVEYTPHGPVVLDVVTAPRPDGTLYTLAPALSNNAIVGTEKLTDIEKDASTAATVVGVNGDFFAANPGSPTGMLMRGGALDFAPAGGRSSLGIAPDGTLSVAQLGFDGTWRGTDQRRQLDLNASPVAGHTTLYTSAWGPTTPAESNVVEDTIGSLPPTTPNRIVAGTVTATAPQGGVPIPAGGAVLVARGAQAPHLTAEAPPGTNVEIRLTLTPDWSSKTGAIGGGPLLVAGGKPVFRAKESFGDPVLNTRSARSAVAQLSDGRILLVTVEGGSLAYSAGMTSYELAVALAHLGAVTAMGLGSGDPAAMAFDGSLLTRPSGPAEQPISDALLLSYTGVYAAPPSTEVVSPNGDGADDTETFTYRLVRAAQVKATLVGPDRSVITLAQDAEQPGQHTVAWSGLTAAGAPAAEGNWKLSVSALDDRGVPSTAERQFSLNDTLGSLHAVPPDAQLVPHARGSVAATFELAHPARVTVTVETRSGIVIATVLDQQLPPGPQKVLWNGRTWTGALAFSGAYQLHVVATNSIGKVSVISPFVAHRQ
ncbi:MAG TPA: phosphodiester glycosidase family protein [Gaiellaceae bacterium]|nr:phosphodiester glycosidase family protein [Gaiellaceae bacterium]